MLIRRRSLILAIFFAVVAVLLTVAPACAKKIETGFLDRTVTVATTEYKYQVFVPDNWTSRKKWPLILFLHGAGERGDDGLIQTEVGIGTAIRRNRSRVPAIVVMPQCRKDVWWTDSAMGDVAMAALEHAQKEFHGDTARIYLTGLSMGVTGPGILPENIRENSQRSLPFAGAFSGRNSRANSPPTIPSPM